VEVLFSFSAASSSASSASVSPINIPLIHSGPKKNHQILALWKPNPPTHTESTRRRPWFFRFWGKNPWNRPPLLYLPMRMGISFSSAAVPELRCRFWYSGGEDLALLAAAVRSRSARPVLAAPFSLARSSPLTPAGWMKRGFPSLDLGTSFFFVSFVARNFGQLPLVLYSTSREHCGIVLSYREKLLRSALFFTLLFFWEMSLPLLCWGKVSIGSDMFIRSGIAFCEPLCIFILLFVSCHIYYTQYDVHFLHSF
jgi:hypothetical protein